MRQDVNEKDGVRAVSSLLTEKDGVRTAEDDLRRMGFGRRHRFKMEFGSGHGGLVTRMVLG